MKNLHSSAKNHLSPKVSGKPSFAKKLADGYFPSAYSNKGRNKKITHHEDLKRPKVPDCPFDSSLPDFGFFSKFVHKKSKESAAGVNGNMCSAYKAWPGVGRILGHLLHSAWKNNMVASSWQKAWIRLLKNSDDTSHHGKMRTISVLNVEGRNSFSAVYKPLLKFLLANKDIDSKVQKGFI